MQIVGADICTISVKYEEQRLVLLLYNMALSVRIVQFERKQAAGLTRNAKECCIHKVHEQLRNVNEQAYKPVVIAIGPYNNQGKVGQGCMEEWKLCYLQQMLKRTNGSIETYTTALKKLEEKARNCYGAPISQTSEEFVEMMVLDGCFIIELFHKFEIFWKTGDCQDDPFFEMVWGLSKIARDLLLFENQLPFFVLEKLFMISERNETLLRARNLGEHPVDIEDGVSVESSTSSAQIFLTRLIDLALKFFSGFLPLKWNDDASSYNSTEKIKHLLCLAHEALTPSLPNMVCKRLKVGFRFKNAEFEHLLGLIHTTISISLLDTEIDNARECQEAGVKLKNAETFEPLFGLKKAISYTKRSQRSVFLIKKEEKMKHLDYLNRIEDWKAIPFGLELQKAGIDFSMANKFKDKLDEIAHWRKIPYAIELQEAGIQLKEAKKFKNLHDQNRNEDRKSIPYVLAEKFKRLLCDIKIETWKSIPYGTELREAGVEFNSARKFKRLLAHREIECRNIHSATELEEAGIKFKIKAEKSNVFSIKFNIGLLEISPLTIEDDTETYLRNLIAYEQYCHRHNDMSYVYSYVRFMDHLINTPKDVKLLRRRGIIHNCLGGDEVLSTMVNKLGHHVRFSSRSSIYARTIMNVNMHCRKRRNVWMAKLRRDYFNSPWALVSFMGVVLLLALSITQTIFSIIH